ncbi:MAG TPA: Sir2 family NAD-dependent protein deacetylase [Geopsychrobacteraceae bacterium]|nr:Sir2 family NAD-dependent protein deacetylase [Geopsychrobacteraceae bacterium]
MNREDLQKAAEAIRNASTIIITSGAGMGVDSGLPDFRGDQGFWNAYPMYQRLNLSFIQAANPEHFEGDPQFGWGFYGHRTDLYRQTVPHEGFSLLQDWIDRYSLDHFIVTSNVDGQFQKAGFSDNRILEVHGSIHHLQCTTPCCNEIWTNEETFDIDHNTMRASRTPTCPHCNRIARPNILMFGDYSWLHHRTSAQEDRFQKFLRINDRKTTVVVEMGAGTSVPTIRHLSEQLGHRQHSTVIRINPREAQIRGGHISLACGTVEGLAGIDAEL